MPDTCDSDKTSKKKIMKTLIMNNSAVMRLVAPASDQAEAILTQLLGGCRLDVSLGGGTLLKIKFETDFGSARFGICSEEGFLLEALVLGTGHGRQWWVAFHDWCEQLLAEGRATGQRPLPFGVPDENSWNCIILYNACQRLTEDELCELVIIQSLLARAYVSRLDQNVARTSQFSLN